MSRPFLYNRLIERHYMQAFTIHLMAKANPIKYILSRSVISRRLAKWAIIHQQYDIVYIPQKIVKSQTSTGIQFHQIGNYVKT